MSDSGRKREEETQAGEGEQETAGEGEQETAGEGQGPYL